MATRRTIVQPGDQVITIAGDDDAIQMSGLTNLNINLESFRDSTTVPVSLDRLLILGWNRRAPMILEQLLQQLCEKMKQQSNID